MKALALFTALAALTACGSGTPTINAPLGKLPDDFGAIAARPTARKAVVHVGRQGVVQKLAVYHTDEKAVPKAVRDLGAKHFPQATLQAYETEWYIERGQVFEAQYDLGNGTTGEVAAQADGTLIYVEKPVSLDVLPKILSKAALKIVGKGSAIQSVEHKLGPDMEEFAVRVTRGDVVHFLRLSPQGKLLSRSLRIPAEVELPFPKKKKK